MRSSRLIPSAFVILIGVAASPMSARSQGMSAANNIWSIASFLDQSSRLALEKSKNPTIIRFASSEAAEQTSVANAIVAWDASKERRAPADRLHTGSMGLISVPLRTAGAFANNIADEVDGLSEGRSVASDDAHRTTEEPERLSEIIAPSFADDLRKLEVSHARAFDLLYEETQHSALLQLSTLYASYIQNGDDASLRALAIRELPKVNSRLAQLPSF